MNKINHILNNPVQSAGKLTITKDPDVCIVNLFSGE